MPDLTGFATLQDFASRQGFDKKYQRIIEDFKNYEVQNV